MGQAGHLVPTLTAGMGSNVGHPGDAGKDEIVLAVASALTTRSNLGCERGDGQDNLIPMRVTHALTAEGADASEDGTGRGTPLVPWMDTAATLTAGVSSDGVSAPGRRQEDEHNIVPWTVSNDSQPVVVRDGTGALKVGTGLGIPSAPAVAYPLALRGREGGAQLEVGPADGPYNALRAGDGGSSRQPMVGVGTAVRRLTPLECERLQGWPDNWTLVPGTSDSQRYKQCGNGITANVAEWIGWRIKAYSEGWRS